MLHHLRSAFPARKTITILVETPLKGSTRLNVPTYFSSRSRSPLNWNYRHFYSIEMCHRMYRWTVGCDPYKIVETLCVICPNVRCACVYVWARERA